MSAAAPAMREGLAALARREDLSCAAAAAIFAEIMAGECTEPQIAGLLMGLAAKGETAEELRGAAEAMRAASTRVTTTRRPVIDTCGTGGSGIARRNVSTAVALAVAACGVAVAKHGNRGASSRSGSADLLEALGVDLAASPERVGRCIDEVGVGFLFARSLHPAMRFAGPVRQALGVRTIFNLLGPLTNPARVVRQTLGVFDPARCEDLALALGAAGSERVFVVHGFFAGVEAGARSPAGIDDLSPEGESWVVEWRAGAAEPLRRHVLRPASAGIEPVAIEAIAGGDPADNAAALRRLLDGARGAYRSAVMYSGALALLVAGDEGLDALPALAQRIAVALDSGAAREVLVRLVAASRAG